jgi:hypothetical protein
MRTIAKIVKFVLLYPFLLLDHIFSSKKSEIIKVVNKEIKTKSGSWVIYVHYSPVDKLEKWELSLIRNLRRGGFNVLLALNVCKLDEVSLSILEKTYNNSVDILVIRKNIGRDLGAYRDSFNFLNQTLSKNQHVYFLNNSIFWFPKVLSNYLNRFENIKSDIVAGFISEQYRKHIQTFFFGFQSERGRLEISGWLNSVKNWKFKRNIINRGEIQTNRFFNETLVIFDYPPTGQVINRLIDNAINSQNLPVSSQKRVKNGLAHLQQGIPCNPSHQHWFEYVQEGFPGVKVELVLSNPINIQDSDVALKYICKNSTTVEDIGPRLIMNKSKKLYFRLRRMI